MGLFQFLNKRCNKICAFFAVFVCFVRKFHSLPHYLNVIFQIYRGLMTCVKKSQPV